MFRSPLRPVVGLLACAATVPMCASPAAADTSGGSTAAPAPVELKTLGSMTWSWYDRSVLTKYPAETARVTAVMNQAINDYNTVANYTADVPTSYEPGVPTAQARYNDSVQFGGQITEPSAQHELSHFMGMQGWVNGGKATWSSLCNAGWANTVALSRMRQYTGDPNVGIGCSADVGHFWDYGLNYAGEWNWLSKGRNVGMVGAMRGDLGLSDGSALPRENVRLVNRSTSQVAADATLTEGSAAIGAPSTVAAQQNWTMSFVNGMVRLTSAASGRLLRVSAGAAKLVTTASPGAAQTWEMAPTTNGYFQLKSQTGEICLRAADAGSALTVSGCNGDASNPGRDPKLEWHLARPAASPPPPPTPTPTPLPKTASFSVNPASLSLLSSWLIASPKQSVTVTNTGSAPGSPGPIVLSGASALRIASSTCGAVRGGRSVPSPASLNPGAQCKVVIFFQTVSFLTKYSATLTAAGKTVQVSATRR